MLVAQPPYALTAAPFRFAALASLAGRAPLGGRREIALAIYLAARLAEDALPGRDLSDQARAARAAHARQWLATLSLPAAVRPTIAALIDASAGPAASVSRCLRAAVVAAGESLDRTSRAELVALAAALDVS